MQTLRSVPGALPADSPHPTMTAEGPLLRDTVLFILPSLGRAGAESQVLDLLETLDHQRWRAVLVTFEPGLEQQPRLQTLPVTHIHIPRRHRIDANLVARLAMVIDRENVRVVHATLNIAVLVGWLACRRSGRRPPLVAGMHTTINRNRRADFIDRLIYLPMLRRCERLIFISHRQREHWLRRFRGKAPASCVVHNGIDVNRYSPGAVDAAGMTVSDGPLVSCVAALRPEKGHDVLLAAWRRVRAHIPGARLALAGSGPEEQRIRRMIRAEHLTESVLLLGALPDVRPLLAGTALTVLPSTAVETLSLAALESMAMEVPVVATPIGGMPEAVIDGKTGRLVPPGDEKALADAVIDLLARPDRLAVMGTAARAHVVAGFDRCRMGQQTQRVLQEVCREHHVASA